MIIGKHSDLPSTGSDIEAQVTIGNYTSIGINCHMYTLHNHACIQHPNLVSTKQLNGYPHPLAKGNIIIGNDVWMGRNVTLLGNITIGDGAIIGAFSVVAKDIQPYAIAIGNPVQIKRYRFTQEQIEALLKIKWWNWEDEIICYNNYIGDLSA